MIAIDEDDSDVIAKLYREDNGVTGVVVVGDEFEIIETLDKSRLVITVPKSALPLEGASDSKEILVELVAEVAGMMSEWFEE